MLRNVKRKTENLFTLSLLFFMLGLRLEDIIILLILRSGISAMKGERLLIPINMRDGALICVGKGNPDWNESAPHGAGRLMSRTDARSSISMKAYKDAMKGILYHLRQ